MDGHKTRRQARALRVMRSAKWLKLLASVESTRRLSTPTRSNQLTIEQQMTNQEFDLHHIWHPYTSLTHPLPCYEVASAKGVKITLSDGRELVDGMSSWWACVHGYQVPELDAAATAQLGKMSHVMFGGLTHAPAVELCRKLVEITPKGLDRVFLADSGSVAVEVALKMAQQYWHARGTPRAKFVALRSGYHGDTFGAMSVCDPDGGMHELYKGFLPEHNFVEAPAAASTPSGMNSAWWSWRHSWRIITKRSPPSYLSP